MAIVHRTLFERDINASRNVDILFGSRGGILLSLDLSWSPFSYFNIGTPEELAKNGDIHVIITDASTSRSPIGQSSVGVNNPDSIVVSAGGSWGWSHPEEDNLESSDLIGRLAYNGSFAEDPIGIVRGNLRLAVQPDPNTGISHNLVIEAKFLSFDTARS